MATMTYSPPPGPPPGFDTGVRYAPPPGPPPQKYSPPPGPPPITAPPQPPPCQNATELSAYVRGNLVILANRGWLAVSLPPDLESVYATLFAESSVFFELPPDAQAKRDFAAPTGKAASDEGFSDIPGEKQLITLRSELKTPPQLREAAKTAWNETGKLFLETIHDIAESLDRPLDLFDGMSVEATNFSEKDRAASLLRLFRYNRPGFNENGGLGMKKVVAEGHKDLGLLTLVVGQSPGLDARDPATGQWVSVEDTPPGAPRLTATLLAGQTLTYLTRGLYASGIHRVSVLPSTSPADKYRFSLVFALRPAPKSTIDTTKFEGGLISKFPEERLSLDLNNFPNCSMYGQPAADLFKAIAQKHWNVNIAPEIREQQKRNLLVGAVSARVDDGDGGCAC
ncbi:hypothetical protein B0H17DRAFT_1093740 [Mycena rosella]|uniref:Fe2OG dioxygenase domain-containing protein n=1 Tax=Mycena rosella TaxID=1033263 RepID=A0AAD7G5N4_MYCRO|nr:hypothetical protein B0H17DRAFT_1093740 [Mycena rosella]